MCLLTGAPCSSLEADQNNAEVELKVKIVSPISVTTRFAWSVGYRMALLHGRLDDMSTSSSVDVYFEWGKTADYGSETKVRRMTHTGRFSTVIHGLTPGTIYHFRAVAEDGSTSHGEDKTFKTRKRWCWPWHCWH